MEPTDYSPAGGLIAGEREKEGYLCERQFEAALPMPVWRVDLEIEKLGFNVGVVAARQHIGQLFHITLTFRFGVGEICGVLKTNQFTVGLGELLIQRDEFLPAKFFHLRRFGRLQLAS